MKLKTLSFNKIQQNIKRLKSLFTFTANNTMDISEVCNLCNKPNDQMLMLKCVHDPCINCAATTYAEQIHIKGQPSQIYLCEICGEQTALDPTTVQQLANLANNYVRSPSKTYQKKSVQQNTSSRKYDASLHAPTSNVKKVVYYCRDHGEQEVTYYCFNCWENICPECAIHGNHKDHNVKMIKKAIAEVKEDYMQKIGKIAGFQNSVVKGKDNFLRIIKSTNDRHVREKHIISKEFQAMRSILSSKQKQLLKQLDEVNKRNIQTLTEILEEVNKNYQESNKLKKNVESVLKKDQVLILQEYKKIGQVQTAIQQLSKETETIGGKVSALNGQYLVDEVKELGESIKKIKLKLDEEKLGVNQYMEGTGGQSGQNSAVKGNYGR